jgi:hypothetical protein
VVSTLDAWTATISLEGAAIVLAPPYVLPSTRYMKSNYPASLTRHLLSLVPSNFPLTPSTPKASKKAPIPSFDPQHAPYTDALEKDQTESESKAGESKYGNSFLGMQTMKAVDVRNWGWPGYLTFGRSTVKKLPDPDKQEKDGSSNEGSTSDAAEKSPQNVLSEGVMHTPEQGTAPTMADEKAFEPLPSFASAVVRIQDDSGDVAPIRQTIFHITARIYFLISLLE